MRGLARGLPHVRRDSGHFRQRRCAGRRAGWPQLAQSGRASWGGGPWVEPRGTVRPWLDGEVVRGHSCWGGMSHTLDTHLPSERSPMWPECQAPWEELAHLQGQEVHHPTANPAPPYIPGL